MNITLRHINGLVIKEFKMSSIPRKDESLFFSEEQEEFRIVNVLRIIDGKGDTTSIDLMVFQL